MNNGREELMKEIEPLTGGFDLLSDHVVITDADGIILYANKAVEENTGFSKEELIGRNPGRVWGGQMPKEFYERMWRTIKTDKKPFVGEVKNVRKNGREYYQELRVFPVLDERGEVRVFIGIEPNITLRKQFEAEQAAKYRVTEQLNHFLTVGRELKMIELKKEIERLRKMLQGAEISESR